MESDFCFQFFKNRNSKWLDCNKMVFPETVFCFQFRKNKTIENIWVFFPFLETSF